MHTPCLLALPPAAWSVRGAPARCSIKETNASPALRLHCCPGLTLPAPPAPLGSFPCWGAWDPGDNLSPPRGQRWLCRMKAEGPGVPVGLAGTAVNPIGRWHSARLRITCSQRLQISLTFPTGRRLWQPAGGPSQHFLSCPNELLLPNDTCSPGNSTALPPVQKSGLSLHGTLSCITRAPEFMLLCNRWWLEHQRG